MNVQISSDAEEDLAEGFWFYERQTVGLGDYFRSCLTSDIDALVFYAGVHERACGYYRALSKRFPFAIYYQLDRDIVTVVAVLDVRRSPQWTRKRLK